MMKSGNSKAPMRTRLLGLLVAIIAGLAVVFIGNNTFFKNGSTKEQLFPRVLETYRLKGNYTYDIAQSPNGADTIAMIIWPKDELSVKQDLNPHQLYVMYYRKFPRIGKYQDMDSLSLEEEEGFSGFRGRKHDYVVGNDSVYETGEFLYSINPDHVAKIIVTDQGKKTEISVDPDQPFVCYLGSEKSEISLFDESGNALKNLDIQYYDFWEKAFSDD